MAEADKHGAVFQGYVTEGRCCLCGCREGPFRFDTRPTGPHLKVQSWPFCSSCWEWFHETNGGAADPHIGRAWLLFVTTLLRGKRFSLESEENLSVASKHEVQDNATLTQLPEADAQTAQTVGAP